MDLMVAQGPSRDIRVNPQAAALSLRVDVGGSRRGCP
jgi:hypothetical protein